MAFGELLAVLYFWVGKSVWGKQMPLPPTPEALQNSK